MTFRKLFSNIIYAPRYQKGITDLEVPIRVFPVFSDMKITKKFFGFRLIFFSPSERIKSTHRELSFDL